MPELGRAALLVTLGLSVYALVAGAAAAHLGRRRLARSAQNALVASFVTTAVAAAVLLAALLRNDFSFAYVARTTSEALPTAYTISAFWGGQEGSLLLWLLVLTGFGAAAVSLNRGWARDLIVWVVPVFAAVSTFFAFLVVAVASPFATQPAPPDGAGMTPSLQNPYMLAHPPLLYLGYVGLTVPFAFAIGALLSGRLDERWLIATRRWTLFAWAALGIGQLLGSHWAYVEVGWGGYYAWDPVENAALMPWLAATAFLHSVMIQEKRGMLRVWNVLLVILAFSLALFGTFLTRSGVVNSIHSFTQSAIGPWFLAFIAFAVAVSLALVFWRLPQLRSPTKLESPISREAAFLYNNLLLLALCLAILWGVVYPMVSEALRGEAIVLGRSYYDFFLRAFGLPLLLLMGIGPLIAWRRASLRSLATTFRWPTGVALVTGVALLLLGAGSSIPGLVAYTFSAFVLATIVMEFARGTRARKALGAASWPVGVRISGLAQPASLRRLRRPCGDCPARARCGRLERVRQGRRSQARTGRVDADRRLYARLPIAGRTRERERHRDSRDTRRAPRRSRTGNAAGRQERVHDRAAGLQRGRHTERSTDGRGPLRHRGADRSGRQHLLPRLREAARQPHLACGARVPHRLAHHAVARPAGAATTCRARVRGRHPGDALTLALVLAATLAVACVVAVALPFIREPEPESDDLDELDDDERRRLRLLEERDRALAALKELEFEHRTGTVSDEDYRAQLGPLRREVASALQALERDLGEGRPVDGRN